MKAAKTTTNSPPSNVQPNVAAGLSGGSCARSSAAPLFGARLVAAAGSHRTGVGGAGRESTFIKAVRFSRGSQTPCRWPLTGPMRVWGLA